MKPILILTLSCMMLCHANAQTVANGNFNGGVTSWGCNPETNVESVYGGVSNSNVVAEVDAVAGLCQTINGFAVGAYYRLAFRCSRRTNCGPTNQTMNVTIDGSVTRAVSRNGTGFSLALETVDFYATSATHTITFTGTTTETCNLLIDDIQITLVSGLPVELSAFTADCLNGKAVISWTTESEERADYFTIERSNNGSFWEKVARVNAQVSSQSRTDYSCLVDESVNGTTYFRLRLTDMDGSEEILSLASLNCENESVMIYPNPTKGILSVNASAADFAGVFDASGRKVTEAVSLLSKYRFDVDLSSLVAGLYYLQLADKRYQIVKE